MNTQKTKIPGPIYVILASLCFSIGGLCIKYIPWHPMAINGARNIISSTIIFLFLKASGHKLRFNRIVLIGALTLSLTTILYTTANKLTTAGNAIILQYTAPVFVMLFSTFIYKRKPSRLDILTAVLVMTGVLFFFVDSLTAGNMLGNVLALLSGITYAGIFMMNSSEESDSLSSTFFGMVINVIIGLPFVLQLDFPSVTAGTWTAILSLGIIQIGLAYIFLNLGLATTPPIAACLINGLEPVLNPVLVAVFYGEVLTPLSIAGAVVVLVTVIGYNILSSVQISSQLP